MCGICGIVDFKSEISKSLVRKMTESIKHRGPDGNGFFFSENVGLGVRRLSIIDIKLGDQPIHNEDSSSWIVFNGEIYNYKTIRKELEGKHKFYTNSDTETILHAYEEWGEKCLEKFVGMFAFVIWETKKNRLFVARDRFGIKPFYYFCDEGKFVFASEIKSILQDRKIKRTPDDKIVYSYLVHGLSDHSEDTFFEKIKRLLPAHYMIVDTSGINVKKYWDLSVNKEIKTEQAKDREYAGKFKELLEDSIRSELISEVPLGTCFSGGLDSSSIVVIINKLLLSKDENAKSIGKKQKTFSVCFKEKEIDEREYIEEVSSVTNVDKNYIFPSAEDLWKNLRKLVYYQDEPFLSSGIYAQWEVMKLASKKVTVVLDGQGGDELLGGYTPYFGFYLFSLFKGKELTKFLKESILSLDLYHPFIRRFLTRKGVIKKIKSLLSEDFVNNYSTASLDKWKPKNLVDMLKMEITEASVPRLLRYEDRNSSAFSVESRVPFLDHRLVEYVFSLPMDQRIRNGWTKHILREAMKNVLPEKIRMRRSKVGFAVPEFDWMLKNKTKIKKVFSSKKFGSRKYFNQEKILGMFDIYCEKGLEDFTKIFWRILNLEMWLQVFIDKNST